MKAKLTPALAEELRRRRRSITSPAAGPAIPHLSTGAPVIPWILVPHALESGSDEGIYPVESGSTS
jgi:hypothetical protein